MNERIKEIATQANPNVTKSYVVGPWYAEDIEKFAELIVQECCDIVRQCRFAPDEDAIVNEIVNHFGVEE